MPNQHDGAPASRASLLDPGNGPTPGRRVDHNGPMALDIRAYDRDTDLAAVDRIWREVGWLDEDRHTDGLRVFLDTSNVEVGLLDGEAECAVVWTPGSIRYQDTDLGLCAVTAVTTSRVGRKQGFATTMTARALRAGAEAGAAVAALGIFDQGFYDRVGFGTGPYELRVNIDPASLALDHVPYRRPIRLTADDHVEMHEAMHRRHRGHGSVVLDPPQVLEAEWNWAPEPFGLGYRDPDGGRLTHFLSGSAKDEHGPYRIAYLSYEQPGQLLELLRLLRELGDQVHTVRLTEPAEIQLQDLVDQPFRRMNQTESSAHATGAAALAFFQYRILDLPACVAARRWAGPTVRFNLALTDPVPDILSRNGDVTDDGEPAWPGVADDWVVTIGATSSAEPGTDPSVESMTASVNAFTRAWLGVRPPSSLAITDDLAAPPALLAALDEALAVPTPHPGWDF